MRSPSRRRAGSLALVAAVLLSGAACAYYNTFHTARTYFRGAEEQQNASGQEHPSPGVLDLYSKSIERSQKVITNYPRSKWVDDARLLIGMAYLRREEYEKGRSAFEELIEKQPKSNLVADATFGIGLCELGAGDWEAGEQTLARLLAENPRYKKRGEVQYQLAQNAAKRRDFRTAVTGYTALLAAEETAGLDLAAVHHARGEAYLALESADSALADFTTAVDLSSVPEERFESKLLAGESLEKLGRYDEALALYTQLEREMPGQKELPRTLLRQGRVENGLGRHPEALAVYARVIKDYPASSYAAEAQYQIGFTQEIYLEDLDAAKESYGKVRELAPGSEFTALAEDRKQSIDLYGQYRTEATEGGEEEKKAAAALMMAEVSLFRLRKIDEAITAYGAIERDYPNSSVAPKAAYAVAWIQEHEQGDSLAAVASYARVFDLYPDTEFGVDAGVRAGLLAADSLSIYRGRVLHLRALADSLVEVSAARAAAARADSLAAAGGDSLGAAPGDSLGAAPVDSLVAAPLDSLGAAPLDSLALARSDTLRPGSPAHRPEEPLPGRAALDSLQRSMPPGVFVPRPGAPGDPPPGVPPGVPPGGSENRVPPEATPPDTMPGAPPPP